MAEIVNEQQLRVTREWLAKFEAATLNWETTERPPGIDPVIWQAQYELLQSMAAELREEIEAYEQQRRH